MAAMADYAVPRDTDPISKSVLGFLLDEREDIISGVCRMIVAFSYYCAGDITEWAKRLSLLNAGIRKVPGKKGPSGRARVLLAGSPIYFPNYKIPFLAQEAGFQIIGCADYTVLKLLSGDFSSEKESRSSATIFLI